MDMTPPLIGLLVGLVVGLLVGAALGATIGGLRVRSGLLARSRGGRGRRDLLRERVTDLEAAASTIARLPRSSPARDALAASRSRCARWSVAGRNSTGGSASSLLR